MDCSRFAFWFSYFLHFFKTYKKEPLILIDGESSDFSYLININNQEIDLADLYFDANTSNQVVSGNDTLEVSFTLDLGGGRRISHTYGIANGTYQIKYQLNLEGFDDVLTVDQLVYHWNDDIKALEKDVEESRLKTTINYYLASEDFEDLKARSDELEEETISEPIKWVAIKQKFFTSSSIIAEDPFTNGYIKTNVNKENENLVKNAEVLLEIPLNETGPSNFTYYFGPNNYQILKKVTDGFSKNIYLGWPPVNFVNKFLIIPIFNFLEDAVGNYGIIILILVIIIRIILFPLSYKSHISMAKTKLLKPELDKIKEEHGNDMQKVQSAQMQLYQKAGVNPLSGCIPVLLQMPILVAMFYFFPNSIELRQEAFLWADDLSTYDSFITWNGTVPLLGSHLSLFTLLMTLSTILYTWMNNQVTSVQGPMKNIGYFMPVVFLFVLNNFSAALTYYYFLSNIFSFGQQAVIRRYVDDEKIRQIMEDNKLKNKHKKKSKFQARLEEAMKAKEEVSTTPKGKGKTKPKTRKRR